MRLFVFIATIVFAGGCSGEVQPGKGEDVAVETDITVVGRHIFDNRPVDEPELLLEGLVSTGENEFGVALSPDNTELYFCRTDRTRSHLSVIMVTRWQDGDWSEPELATFSGDGFDVDPAFAPDGNTLFFNRRVPNEEKSEDDLKIFMVKRDGLGWTDPVMLPGPINDAPVNVFQTLTEDGTMYFGSIRDEGYGGLDIYRSALLDGEYQEPENLGPVINGENNDTNPVIDPEGRFLIFLKNRVLMISYNTGGNWSEPTELPQTGSEFAPALSFDGKWFFIGRYEDTERLTKPLNVEEFQRAISGPRNGLADIYFMPLENLDLGVE
jgi:hypothetical protein